MQFVYGSGKGGYGLLYTSGVDAKNADIVREIIKFDGRTDSNVYGYIPFGVNNKRSLFFKIGSDSGYNRSTYFIHGIFDNENHDDPVKKYMNGFELDFVDQEGFNKLRESDEGYRKSLEDHDLLTRNGTKRAVLNKVEIENEELLADILTEIYSGSKIVIRLCDDYSIDNARALMRFLFGYLTTSVKKECSFIAGNDSFGDFQVRVVDGKAAVDSRAKVFSVGMSEHYVSKNPSPKENTLAFIIRTLNAIKKRDAGTVDEFFAAYETMCNGFNSRYSARRFTEFFERWIKIRKRDSTAEDAADSMIESYLKDKSVFDFKSCLKFRDTLKELVSAKYEKNNTGYYGLNLNCDSFRCIFEPQSVFKDNKNTVAVKKIFIFTDSTRDASECLVRAYKEYFDTQEIKDKNLETLIESMSAEYVRPKDDSAEYRKALYDAVEIFRKGYLTPFVNECQALLQGGVDVGREYLQQRPMRRVIGESEEAEVVRRMYERWKETKKSFRYLSEKRVQGFRETLLGVFRRLIASHNEKCRLEKTLQPEDAEYIYRDNLARPSLGVLKDMINDGRYDAAEGLLLKAISYQDFKKDGTFRENVIRSIVRYVEGIEVGSNNLVLERLSKHETAFKEVFSQLVDTRADNDKAMRMVINYGDIALVFDNLISLVNINSMEVRLSDEAFDRLERFQNWLELRLKKEGQLSAEKRNAICSSIRKLVYPEDAPAPKLERHVCYYVNFMIAALLNTNNADASITLLKPPSSLKRNIIAAVGITAVLVLLAIFALVAYKSLPEGQDGAKKEQDYIYTSGAAVNDSGRNASGTPAYSDAPETA